MIRRLVLLALLCASDAGAATYYYNIATGNNTTGTGSAGNPFKTISHANNRPEGSVIILQSSSITTYDTQISPVNGNTTWIGDSADAYKVRVPGVYLKVVSGGQGQSGHIDNTLINGITVLNNVHVEAAPTFGYADGFHLRNSNVMGEVYLQDVDARFYADSIGHNGVNGSHFRSFNSAKIGRVNLTSNVMNLRPGALTDWRASYYLFGLWAETPETRPRQYDTLTANTITITLPKNTNYEKLAFMRGIQYALLSQNAWTFRDSSGTAVGGTTAQGIVFRDCYRYNRSLNETYTFTTLIAGTGGLNAQMPGPGSTNQGFDNTCYQNTWAFATMKSDIPVAHAPFGATWQLGNNDSLVQNTIVTSAAVANTGYFVHNAVGTSYILRNTLVALGGGGAVRIGTTLPEGTDTPCSAWTGTVNFRGNICYTNSTGTGANDYAAAFFWQSGGAGIDADYNLYAHYVSAGARSILGGVCGSSGQVFDVGPLSALCSTLGNDCSSLYGSPQFADTSYATFSNALLTGSAAVGGYLGANIGSWDGTPGGADATAPSAVTDLTSTGVGSDVATFSWTARGDDGASGTATTYTIKYSTSPISEGNFAAATSVANLAAPQATGTTEYVVIPGLSPSTTYYVAIKSADETPNTSAISNVVRITTLAISGKDVFTE